MLSAPVVEALKRRSAQQAPDELQERAARLVGELLLGGELGPENGG